MYQNYLVLKIRDASLFDDFSAARKRFAMFRKNGTAFCFWTILSVATISLFLYVILIGLTVSTNYELSNYKARLANLEEKNQEMEIQASQSDSFGNLADAAARLNLVEVRQVDYIKLSQPNLALNEKLEN